MFILLEKISPKEFEVEALEWCQVMIDMETWVSPTLPFFYQSKFFFVSQNTLSKGYYVNPNGKAFKTGSLQSPTHSYSSSEGGNYAIMDNRIKLETSPNEIHNHNRYSAPLNYQGEDTTARGVLNNRRSAPEFLSENWSLSDKTYYLCDGQN